VVQVKGIKGIRNKLVAALAAVTALIAGFLFAVPTTQTQMAMAAPSSTAVDVPCRDPRGCPDLILNEKKLNSTRLTTETFPAEDCAVQEGQVVAGTRRLLRFPYSTPNVGSGALIIGNPADPANSNLFEWGACHRHYHFKKYAAYRLWTPAEFQKFQQLKAQNPDMLSGDIIASNGLHLVVGAKRGFCIIDFAPAEGDDFSGHRDKRTYTECITNQGISIGWADTYMSQLSGQWIDVTDVADGDYILEVETNPEHSFQEARYDNNSASKPVRVTH
jgi:Lysyl oxidase